MKKLLTILFFVLGNVLYAQSLYKTPSGKKYHLGSCRMVKNVSKKIDKNTINYYHLMPCRICKPPIYRFYGGFSDKSVGKSLTVRCKGKTKRGTRCKHKTRLANGYCYQHQPN
ncbi:MAG: hypothetical protein KGV44_14305 [Flavobacteriaceae bacterium]|nr:hypothetical protein [Flavobacteriaceae bacterium]